MQPSYSHNLPMIFPQPSRCVAVRRGQPASDPPAWIGGPPNALDPSAGPGTRLTLDARMASDLMSANVTSLRQEAGLIDAMRLLIDKGFHAVPVVDEAGHPVGVLSKSDL